MMQVKLKMYLVFIASTLILTGCTGLSPDRYLANKQKFMLDQGDPPAYVAGYVDGCAAGRRLAGDKSFVYRKNNTRFEKDALYARGWQEAQINCRNEALAQDLRGLVDPKKKDDQELSGIGAEKKRKMDAKSRAVEAEMHEIWEELKK